MERYIWIAWWFLFSVRHSRLCGVHHENMKHYPLIVLFIFTSKGLIKDLFKLKDGYRLELQILETIKLFGSTKKTNRQNKEWRKRTKSWSGWSSFSPIQYEQTSEVLYSFMATC